MFRRRKSSVYQTRTPEIRGSFKEALNVANSPDWPRCFCLYCMVDKHVEFILIVSYV